MGRAKSRYPLKNKDIVKEGLNKFNYSTKNIPIPSRDEYFYQLIHTGKYYAKILMKISDVTWNISS